MGQLVSEKLHFLHRVQFVIEHHFFVIILGDQHAIFKVADEYVRVRQPRTIGEYTQTRGAINQRQRDRCSREWVRRNDDDTIS